MEDLSTTSAALVSTLHRIRVDLAARGDLAGAEQVLVLMTATAAADEMVSASDRQDAGGVEFHLGLLRRSLESASPISFEHLG